MLDEGPGLNEVGPHGIEKKSAMNQREEEQGGKSQTIEKKIMVFDLLVDRAQKSNEHKKEQPCIETKKDGLRAKNTSSKGETGDKKKRGTLVECNELVWKKKKPRLMLISGKGLEDNGSL